MKASTWDVIFIVGITVILVILSETNKLGVLIKLPFVTIYGAYAIGRFAGEFNRRKEIRKNK